MLKNSAKVEIPRNDNNYESMKEIWDVLNYEDRRFLCILRGVNINNKKESIFDPNIGFSEEYALKRFPISVVNYSFLSSSNFISRIDRKNISRDFVTTWKERIDKNCEFLPSFVQNEYGDDIELAKKYNEQFNEVYDKEIAIMNCLNDGENMRIVATEECLEFLGKFFNGTE
jgi:hypothetical protein